MANIISTQDKNNPISLSVIFLFFITTIFKKWCVVVFEYFYFLSFFSSSFFLGNKKRSEKQLRQWIDSFPNQNFIK